MYRVAPNAMVVVPTSEHVSLSYARTGLDWVTIALSLIGVGLCVRWRREGDVTLGETRSAAGADDIEFPTDDGGVVAETESGAI